jgi:hypothetical protein
MVTTEKPVEGLAFEFRRNVKRVAGNATLAENDRRIVMGPLKVGDSRSMKIYYAD